MSKNDTYISVNTSEVCPKDELDKKCAPGLKFEAGSCIPLSLLIQIAEAYNAEYDNKSIKLYSHHEILNPYKYKKYLVHQLTERLYDKPQRSWMKLPFIKKMKEMHKEQLEKYTFRPEGPSGRWEWLNTLHIDDTMTQYEQKYPEFKYLGTVPIDFDEFERFGIKNLNYSQLVKSGKTKFGIVFNLDEHDQPGSHWVSLYADVKNGDVLFFDSYGTVPEERIRKLMRRMARFAQTGMGNKSLQVGYNKNSDIIYNTEQHQHGNSECGVYSMNFILRMLRGDTFEEVCQSKIPDKKINKCRNVYFGNANFKK